MLIRLDNEVKQFKEELFRISWYMRGGVSYEDVLNMCESEREALSQIIDENLETTKKTQLPFF